MIMNDNSRTFANVHEWLRMIMNVYERWTFTMAGMVQMKVHEKESREVMNKRYCTKIYIWETHILLNRNKIYVFRVAKMLT